MSIFPEHFLRGLRVSHYLDERGQVLSGAFRPDTRKKRSDGDYDISINWYEDEYAIKVTLSDRNNAKYGAAVVPRKAVTTINELPRSKDSLRYEWDRLKRNNYHGNLIFSGKLRPKEITAVTNVLMLFVQRWIPPPE